MFRGVITCLAVVAISCAGGGTPAQPTVPATPGTVPPPSPPGSSSANVAGTWVGTFDTSDPADCHTNTPASATFEQEEGTVRGVLSAVNACGLSAVVFDGGFQDGYLRGALTLGELSGSAVGTLSGGALELRTSDISGGGFLVPAGVMHLHRSE
jgi:hypothetical protein